ncbi:hypothetical protein ACKI1J_42990 [Streptomyces scabiei]|uniref:hypothetical protein n=1 Tax=Streptomyces scabiei TaxID=1930 RepID=UPI0038F636CD
MTPRTSAEFSPNRCTPGGHACAWTTPGRSRKYTHRHPARSSTTGPASPAGHLDQPVRDQLPAPALDPYGAEVQADHAQPVCRHRTEPLKEHVE